MWDGILWYLILVTFQNIIRYICRAYRRSPDFIYISLSFIIAGMCIFTNVGGYIATLLQVSNSPVHLYILSFYCSIVLLFYILYSIFHILYSIWQILISSIKYFIFIFISTQPEKGLSYCYEQEVIANHLVLSSSVFLWPVGVISRYQFESYSSICYHRIMWGFVLSKWIL